MVFLIGIISVNIKEPVVPQYQIKTSVIHGFNSDNISHGFGTKTEEDCLMNSFSLWSVTRQVKDGNLFIGGQHNKIGTENNSSFSCLEIIELNSCVMRSFIGDNSGFVCVITLFREYSLFIPEALMSLKQIGFTSNIFDLTSSVVSHIDSFVFIEGNFFSLFLYDNFYGWNVLSWTFDQPTFTSYVLNSSIVGEIFSCFDETDVFFTQHDDLLLSIVFHTFTRLKEESFFSFDE
jgi:hypothetical protein